MGNIITIVIILLLVLFLIDGARRGLVRQILEIIGLVAAFVCAYYVHDYLVSEHVRTIRASRELFSVGAAVFVFVAIVILFHFIGLLLGKIMSVSVLGPVDKVGGAILGACKGVLFVSLLCLICFTLPFPDHFKERLKADPLATRIHPILPRLYESIFRQSPAESDLKKMVRAEPN